MCCWGGNKNWVTIFWKFFQECFQLVNKYDESFSVVGIVVDMAGANFSGIHGERILDIDERVRVLQLLCPALLQLDFLMEMKGYTPHTTHHHNYVYIVLLGKTNKSLVSP